MPDTAALRRATRAAFGVGVATLVALVLLFAVVLHPVPPSGACTTGLYPGTYADLLVPAHLVAFMVLLGAASWLGALRDGLRRPPARAGGALLLVCVLVGAFVVVPAAGGVFVLAGPLAAVILAWIGGVRAVATARTAGLGIEERWRRLGRLAEAALWGASFLVVPAVFAGAYLNGAGLFCF